MEDQIQAIPKTMEKFFGCSGKMVKPCDSTVKALVRKIRKGKLITIDQLRAQLSKDFKVQVACPASTNKALQIAAAEDNPVCYWRVVKTQGALLTKYPGGVEGHAALLEKEGFEIDFGKKNP